MMNERHTTPEWPAQRPRPRLGSLLVEAGAVTEAQLARALEEQSSWGGRLGQNLVALGFLDEETLAATVARQWGLPLAELDRRPPPARAAEVLPVGLAERYGVLALDDGEGPGGRLRVACIDPTSGEAVREVRRATGMVPALSVATPSQVDRWIRRLYYGEATTPPPVDPRFNVTRHALSAAPAEAGQAPAPLHGIEARLEALEERLRRIEAALAARRPR